VLTFTPEHLEKTGRAIFEAAGAPPDLAARLMHALVDSNLAGHDSHGVIRIPAYVKAIEDGKIKPAARPNTQQESPTTAIVDGAWSFGHVAAEFAMQVAIKKARETNVGAVGVIRCNHIGRVGEYSEMASNAGCLGMVFVGGTTGSGIAAPFGGAGRAFSTNPLSFGVPAGEHPAILIDFATTVVAEGKVQVARAKHAQLPPGCIVDKDGNPSTNPEDLYNGGMLLPFGGHKGYALAMLASLLGGALTGNDNVNGGAGSGGAFMVAINIEAFRPREDYNRTVDTFFDKIKAIPPAPGFDEVLIPGEPELRTREARRRDGIQVAEDTWEAIQKAARGLGVEVTAQV
jgi:hydroxycarboxylate dehydrogenase B